MKIGANQKLVMIGDSITDAGRGRPVGENWPGTLGTGYVNEVENLLRVVYGRLNIRVVNMGNSGDTVRELRGRWKEDVLDLKPDWLSIMIGTNDVWRHFDCPRQTEWHFSVDEYESVYRQIIQQVRPSLHGLVLMAPFYIEGNPHDPMRSMMDRYGQAVRKLAAENDAIFVDTQAAFNAAMQDIPTQSLASDRVHPNNVGSMVIARAFLQALDFDWNGN